MRLSQQLFAILGVGTACARPFEARDLEWRPCSDLPVEDSVAECATMPVPLDYLNESSPDIMLQLARIPAEKQPSKGSVLFNFGGPGMEARMSLIQGAPMLAAGTGGVYDLVAFDPRGTANTIPFNCSTSDIDPYAFSTESQIGNETANSDEHNWAHAGWVAGKCAQVHADTGAFLGTASVATDLIRVVDALEEDKMLRYWGLSYGAVLGQTVAAMFPEKIDRVVIDAVQNVHEYYNSQATYQQWSASDEIRMRMWETCLEAGPDQCPLVVSFDDPQAIDDAVLSWLDSLKTNPVLVGSNNDIKLTYQQAMSIIPIAGYTTTRWPNMTEIMNRVLQEDYGDETAELMINYGLHATTASYITDGLTSLHTMGIQCSDGNVRTDTLEDLKPALDRLNSGSKISGPVSHSIVHACARWPFDAKLKYDGEWADLSTQHPMLIVGNSYDGHTPIASAHNASTIFRDSVVLEVGGSGHGSTALISECATLTLAEYFVNGTLPEPGSVCPIDLQPYMQLPE